MGGASHGTLAGAADHADTVRRKDDTITSAEGNSFHVVTSAAAVQGGGPRGKGAGTTGRIPTVGVGPGLPFPSK
ncbi:hypothetical protein GCM10025871_11430 [Deinococcus metallilatus]|nr:hypothetical protein GCM10025871_11430 [Deinococcus metallilatus]